MKFVKVKNGNYTMYLDLETGTKIRKNDLDFFDPEKPESMDIKITNKCDMGCAFCHENSTPDGLHGDIMNLKFIETLLPYTELAIGGGNPLTHPDLIPFLEKCKALKLVPSMTINQYHFMKPEYEELIDKLVNEKLIYGLGVSLTVASDEFINKIKKYPNAVIHIINGVQSLNQVKKLYDHNLKVLILGYKMFRRGIEYFSEAVDIIKNDYYNELAEMTKHFDVVSFDNLALKQLEVKRLLTEDEWNEFFMGDDGSHTMYIDCINKQYARSSTAPIEDRQSLLDDIKPMFGYIKSLK
jgi:MoaA/NifB/PqqE/SkfB family radical SAM enzyme